MWHEINDESLRNQLLWDWTTYHNDPARLALFVYRAYYMTLFNTFTLHAGLWSSGMTLASHGEHPWFETHTILCSIGGGGGYCLQYFVLFALFFSHWLIYIFLSHWHSHINFYSQFSQAIRRCKDCNACKNRWYLCIVLLRDITQNTTDRNIADFSVLLLILKKVPGKGAFIVYQGFYIWNLDRKYT